MIGAKLVGWFFLLEGEEKGGRLRKQLEIIE